MMGTRLPKQAHKWLMDTCSHGCVGEIHTSDDYPRVLEARGLVVRHGRGMLGHLHRLEVTPEGNELANRLLISRLLCRLWHPEAPAVQGGNAIHG